MKILLLLGIFATWFPLAHGFANYLLTDSNCLIELDPSEVIMNHPVVPHTESDDPTFRLEATRLEGGTIITSYPTTISVKLVSDKTKDFQFVMDTEGGHFQQGSCEGKQRISGRSGETIAWTIDQASARLVAGWATSHEPVRLVPPIVLGDSPEAWHDFVISEIGCASVQFNDVTNIQNHNVQKTMYKLAMDEKNRVTFPHKFETLVLQATHGASFDQGFCNHDRIVVQDHDWPVLNIHEHTTIYVYGIFSLPNDESLYQTEFLELEWQDEEEKHETVEIQQVHTTEPPAKHEEPIQIEDQHDYEHHEVDLLGDAKDARRAEDSEEQDDESDDEDEETNQKEKHHNKQRRHYRANKAARKERAAAARETNDNKPRFNPKLLAKHRKRRDAQHEIDAKIQALPNNIREQADAHRRRKELENDDETDFELGSSYYVGLLLLVSLNAGAIYTFRMCGRHRKGRRDL